MLERLSDANRARWFLLGSVLVTGTLYTIPYGWYVAGASAIKCCYAATGIGMTAAAAALCELANTSTSLGDEIGLRGDVKMSRMVSRRVASPACIAGVRVSRPNFSARCGRTKL